MPLSAESPWLELGWFENARVQGTSTELALSYFDSLQSVRVEDLAGRWRGSGFPTGHRWDGLLEKFGWYGKEFLDSEHVYPLLFETPRQRIFVLNPARLPIGLLDIFNFSKFPLVGMMFRFVAPVLATRKATARLRMVEYRDCLTAGMIYDRLPIIDMFRHIDADHVLGLMDYRGHRKPYFFVLTKEAAVSS